MSDEAAVISVKDRVGTIKLNRPEKLNALNGEMGDRMMAALSDWAMDPRTAAEC